MSATSLRTGALVALASSFLLAALLPGAAEADDRARATADAPPAEADAPPAEPVDPVNPPAPTAPPTDAAAPDAATPDVHLDEIVVRTSRPEPAGPGAATTVVEAERFAGEVKGVAELVATAPGVAVREHGGLGQLATVSIRGASASGVKVLLDGLPLDTAAGGAVNLSSIPRAWIDSVEVVRGVEGARFGAGALGGALNVVTPRVLGGRWSAQLHGGSFGTWRTAADVGAGDADAGALISLGWDRTDGDFPYAFDRTPATRGDALARHVRRNNEGQSAGLLAKGHLRALGGRFDAVFLASGGERELPSTQPAADDPGDATPLFARQDDTRVAAVTRHARSLGPSTWWTGELSARHERLALRDERRNRSDQRDTAAAAKSTLGFAGHGHTVEIATSAGFERLVGTGLGARSGPELSASVSDEITAGRLRLGPAVRWDRDGGFSGVSAKLGASVAVAGPLSVRAGAGRTFRAPSFSELYLVQATLEPNPALQPEQGLGGDLGLVARGRHGISAVGAFATLYDDLIVYESASFGRVKPFNMNRVLVQGVELEAGSVPWGPAGLSAQLAYTYLVATNKRGPAGVVGNDVPHRPRHRAFARLAAGRGPVESHVEAHHVSRQWRTASNLDRIGESTVFNAGASVRLTTRGDLRLHLEVRNLTDDRTLHDGFGNPLPSRMVLIGLRASSTQKGTP